MQAFGVTDSGIGSAPIVPPSTSTERTWGEVGTDLGASLKQGFGSLLQQPGQFYGVTTGAISKPDFTDTGLYGIGKRMEESATAWQWANYEHKKTPVSPPTTATTETTSMSPTPPMPTDAEAMHGLIGSGVSIVIGIVLFWLVAGRRYKHRSDTPNDVRLWWAGILGGLGFTLMLRGFIDKNIDILWHPNAWDQALVTQVIVGTVIAFAIGYGIGWMISKVRGNSGPAKASSVMDAEVTEVKGKTIVVCPSCGQKCFVPINKTLEIKCPKCGNVWTETTNESKDEHIPHMGAASLATSPAKFSSFSLDWLLPVITAIVIGKTLGGLGGLVTVSAYYFLRSKIGIWWAAIISAVAGIAAAFALTLVLRN